MRDEVKMDANRLIAEVYKRPALWNQRHISYHNREVTNRVWMEIAAIFNLPSTCKHPRVRVVPRRVARSHARCRATQRAAQPPARMRRSSPPTASRQVTKDLATARLTSMTHTRPQGCLSESVISGKHDA